MHGSFPRKRIFAISIRRGDLHMFQRITDTHVLGYPISFISLLALRTSRENQTYK